MLPVISALLAFVAGLFRSTVPGTTGPAASIGGLSTDH